ncbi:uncharacterized protein LOC129786022 [Lutzomyia longipalpis]|uniref:uncharacterized protein LOC129786022 n=1 Tax=Lutzomyia longipalpis TaxID=7200 RepID=UPI002483BB5E|nr:uncharacterized protein LOC129786022 [Lutzomyia longipalpis]
MKEQKELKDDLPPLGSVSFYSYEKKFKILSLIVAIYQSILSFCVLIFVILSLKHAVEIFQLLEDDIKDEKEMNENTVMPHSVGDSINLIRFKSAEKLSKLTLVVLYVVAAIIVPYTFSCIVLFMGILKNRRHLFIPYLILNFIVYFVIISYFLYEGINSYRFSVVVQYWYIGFIIGVLDITNWFIVRRYYGFLQRADKYTSQLVESATVKIPFHYKKENTYLGNGGYKHYLTDPLVDELNITI